VGGGEDAPHRQLGPVEGRVRGEHGLRAQVDDAEARRADEAHAAPGAGRAQPRLAGEPLAPGFGEAVGEHGRDLNAQPAAVLDHGHSRFRRCHDIDMLGWLRQRRERRPRALAQHALAPRIDGIDAPRIAHLPQEFERPSGGLGGVVRLPDDGDGARREQILTKVFQCCRAALTPPPRPALAGAGRSGGRRCARRCGSSSSRSSRPRSSNRGSAACTIPPGCPGCSPWRP
jgi:hypothetical protein